MMAVFWGGHLIKFWRTLQFLSALKVVVSGYTEAFVPTRLNGVASWEAASLTLSDAGPMYERYRFLCDL